MPNKLIDNYETNEFGLLTGESLVWTGSGEGGENSGKVRLM